MQYQKNIKRINWKNILSLGQVEPLLIDTWIKNKNMGENLENSVSEYGKILVAWEVDEFPNHDRTRTWYIIGAIVAVTLIIYAIFTANFLFAVIILLAGLVTLLSTFQPPEKLDVAITSTGVIIGDHYHSFKEIRDFSIAYEPPAVKLLYFDFTSPWVPLVSIPLEDNDPNYVRECLLPFCLENLERSEETLTDYVKRLYKL